MNSANTGECADHALKYGDIQTYWVPDVIEALPPRSEIKAINEAEGFSDACT